MKWYIILTRKVVAGGKVMEAPMTLAKYFRTKKEALAYAGYLNESGKGKAKVIKQGERRF